MAMALEQTLMISTNNSLLTSTFKTHLITPHIRFFSLTTNNKTLCSNGHRISCSYDFNNTTTTSNNDNGLSGPFEGPKYPRPTEVQWKKELTNSIQLLGSVTMPVQVKHLPSGKVLAWSRIAVKRSQNETLSINLTFWDELAQIASQHLEIGNQIYVAGRLVSDIIEKEEGKQQTFYKVVVQELNFVERSLSSGILNDGDSNFTTPGRKQSSAANSTRSVEELWQAFFSNPVEWWDNRKNKRSPNYPDFKHKDTGEALWVEGRTNPPWVKSQLAILDSKMEAFTDQNVDSQVSFMSADNLPLF